MAYPVSRRWKLAVLCVAIGILAVLVSGCASSTKMKMIDPATPLACGPSPRTMEYANITCDLEADAVVGHWHGGLLNIPYGDLTASLVIEATPLFPGAVEEELAEAGYALVRKKSSVFGEVTEGDVEQDISIGGTITAAEYDTYSSVAGTKGEATVTVMWKLLDHQKNEIVYTMEAQGEAEGSDQDKMAIVGAVRASLREVLADPDFVELVSG